ncbi:hypothetical protein ACK314_10615 [Aeromonas caviae]|uniref:hypothetical protein n=1 Tax=Aeromonas veronii TaxID=654 RepID=UPI00191DE6DD|nr:hypothetical protein [Aeromonas veronii]MBL0622890.1 hypothetical protein [Aeromonas veronii]
MNQPPGKSHLTALNILLELRCWLADNVEMQAEPAIVAHLPSGYLLTQTDCIEAIDTLLHQLRHYPRQEGTSTMRLPNPFSLEETLEKLRHSLTAVSNEDALTLLEKAITKARDDRRYAKQFEETLLQGSTIEIREYLSCFGDYVERSRDVPPYYPHHDAVNGIDCALYAILFDTAYSDAGLAQQ